jgi:hypothetical protein
MSGRLKIYNDSTSSWDYVADGIYGQTADYIYEITADNGVVVDGLRIKDNKLATDNSVVTTNITDGNVTTVKIADDAVTPAKWTNPYCFKVYATTPTTLTDASVIQLTLNTEVYDYNGNFATNAYTVPVSGVYSFSMGFQLTTTATGVRAFCLIYVDGAEPTDGTSGIGRGGGFPAGSNTPSSHTTELLLTAGQIVTFRAYQDSAGNEDTLMAWASGHLIHAT